MILLTGSMGYVGGIIKRGLSGKHEILPLDVREPEQLGSLRVDLSDADSVKRLADRTHPEIILHAAGNKDIGYCERNSAKAYESNRDTVINLAVNFGDRCRILYLSTDYVFRGDRGGYAEHETPDPRTVYGKSKESGETEGFRIAPGNFTVVRSSAIFDSDATFPRFLQENLSRRRPVECFSDIVYSPTYCKDLVSALDRIITEPPPGRQILHVCGETVSRFDFAMAFADVFGYDSSLVRKASSSGKGTFLFPDLSLDNRKTRTLLGLEPTPLREALRDMRREMLL